MPPRRSSRATSAKPAQPVEKAPEKPHPRARSIPARKRAASPERAASPPPKRSRTNSRKSENEAPEDVKKPSSKPKPAKAEKATKKTPKAKLSSIAEAPASQPPASESPVLLSPSSQTTAPGSQSQSIPYFNALPIPPQKLRPPLQLFVWGAGNFGQFGMGPDELGEKDKMTRNTWIEDQISAGTFGESGAGLEAVAAGGLHTLFIDEKGTVWSCGNNDEAALGRVTQDVPDPERPGTSVDIDQLTSIPHPLQSLVDEKFRAVLIAAGDNVSAAVSAEGELRVWGTFRANEGSLGFQQGLRHQFVPVSILKLGQKHGQSEKVSSIVAGTNHLIVLTTHGNVYTLGAGEQAQLGRKVLDRRKIHGTVPEKIVLGSRSRKAVVIGAGAYHSFAVDENGTVWGWGLNAMGQVGTGHASSEDDIVQLPQKVKGLSKEELGGDKVVQIAAGEHHTLFRTETGKVYGCGRAESGQLGLANDDPAFNERPDRDFVTEPALIRFPDPTDPIVHISAAAHCNMATTVGGALYSWGQGTQGELGVPDEVLRTPKQLVRKDGGKWFAASASCGGQHTLGLFRKKE